MATGSVKLGVSGIGEFKSAMTQAKNSTRTLESEMKLAQAQFRATGDAETYMQQRASILTQQISQQQAALDAARGAMERLDSQGIDPASASYQQMQRAAYDAERELVRLRQEADRTGDELLDTSTNAETFGSRLKSISTGITFQSITSGLSSVSNVISQVASRVEQVVNQIIEAGKWADELATTSKQYGLSPEEMQQWENAARFIDTDVNAMLKARDKLMGKMVSTEQLRAYERELETATGDELTKLQAKIGEAYFLQLSDGVKGYAVALRDASGEARDSMEVFWDFIDTLQKFDSETEKDRIAQEYFGKSFRELKTLIEAGREGWEDAAKRSSIVTEESVDALTKLDDARQGFEAELDATKKRAAASHAEMMTDLYNWGSIALKIGNDTPLREGEIETVENTIDAIGAYSNWFEDTFGGIMDFFGIHKPEAEKSAEEAGQVAAEAFVSGAVDNADAIYQAGAALAAAAVRGMASATPGAGSVTNNSTTQNFGDTFVFNTEGNDALNAAIAANHRRQAAGYGG